MTELEERVRELRITLEGWKEVILFSSKVLNWEQNWHPTALLGGSTILFTFLWLLEPSILTTIAVFGLFLTIGDYVVPLVARSVFKDKWGPQEDKSLEEICANIILYKARFHQAWENYYRLKTTNRKMYLTLTVIALVVLAWIGWTFNNLFLSFVFVNVVLLLPGMERNGILYSWRRYAENFVGEILRQTRSKAVEGKNE